jgi:hypothetical protein
MQWHTRTLLSIYWICAAFYQCFYNQTLNISHKSYCINGVLWNVPSCFLYESNLWHCAFVLMKNEYEKHISQRTRIPKKKTTTRKHIAQRTPFMRCGNISYSNWSLLSTNIIIKMRLFGICVLRGEHMSDFLHFLFRAYLVVWVLLLHCLTNTIMSHMCLLRILSFLYAFGIWLERLGKSGREPWHDWAWLKKQYIDQRMFSL